MSPEGKADPRPLICSGRPSWIFHMQPVEQPRSQHGLASMQVHPSGNRLSNQQPANDAGARAVRTDASAARSGQVSPRERPVPGDLPRPDRQPPATARRRHRESKETRLPLSEAHSDQKRLERTVAACADPLEGNTDDGTMPTCRPQAGRRTSSLVGTALPRETGSSGRSSTGGTAACARPPTRTSRSGTPAVQRRRSSLPLHLASA